MEPSCKRADAAATKQPEVRPAEADLTESARASPARASRGYTRDPEAGLKAKLSDRKLDRKLLARPLDGVVAERVDHLRTVEEPALLLRREPVLDVTILEDLGERTPARVLPQHVRRDPILGARTREEEGEGVPQEACEPLHRGDCTIARR